MGIYCFSCSGNQATADIKNVSARLVTTHSLRKTVTTKQAFTNPDGSAIAVNKDYMGVKRNRKRPCPGAFELPAYGNQEWLVWKKND